jgi:hypothetical protein
MLLSFVGVSQKRCTERLHGRIARRNDTTARLSPFAPVGGTMWAAMSIGFQI